MPGQYLRTNYRVTGGLLDAVALGQGFIKGSWGAGAGIDNIGPIIMGSWGPGNFPGTETSCVISIMGGSAVASFCGCDKCGDGSGYKVFPFFIRSKTRNPVMSVSAPVLFASLSTCAGASQFFVWAGGSTVSVLGGCTSGDGGPSAAFFWIGLVVSTP